MSCIFSVTYIVRGSKREGKIPQRRRLGPLWWEWNYIILFDTATQHKWLYAISVRGHPLDEALRKWILLYHEEATSNYECIYLLAQKSTSKKLFWRYTCRNTKNYALKLWFLLENCWKLSECQYLGEWLNKQWCSHTGELYADLLKKKSRRFLWNDRYNSPNIFSEKKTRWKKNVYNVLLVPKTEAVIRSRWKQSWIERK